MLRESESKMAKERGWRIKIVERGGEKISSRIDKDSWSDPCSREDCLICCSAETDPIGRRERHSQRMAAVTR